MTERPVFAEMKHSHTITFQCLQRWNSGEKEGLEELIERHLPWIRRRVQQRLGPKLRQMVESLDVVQDAAFQFFQYGPNIVLSDEEHFRALLARIIENVLRNQSEWFSAQRRQVARNRPLPTETVLHLEGSLVTDRTPSQSVERHEREAWIRLGIELLDAKNREVIVLRQWESLSYDEIGLRLKIPANTARMRYERALKRLAKTVGAIRRGEISQVIQ